MEKKEQFIGKKFGLLTPIEPVKNRKYYWVFRCDCGRDKIAYKGNVIRGGIRSCGCIRNTLPITKTGGSYYQTKTYRTWSNMLSRCRSTSHPRYSNYGGRGITVCDRWMNFENFLEDMGDKPRKLSLDRIDNEKGYFKENCRWATYKEQARNTRRNVRIPYRGKLYFTSDLAKILNVSGSAVLKRYHLGIPLDEIKHYGRSKKKIDVSDFQYSHNMEEDIKRLKKIGCTYAQIGDIFSLTRQRIHQIFHGIDTNRNR